MSTTIKYLRGAARIGLGTTANYLRRTKSCAAGNGLGITAMHLRGTMRGAAGIGLGATINYLQTRNSRRS
jgi:hypothetical protein